MKWKGEEGMGIQVGNRKSWGKEGIRYLLHMAKGFLYGGSGGNGDNTHTLPHFIAYTPCSSQLAFRAYTSSSSQSLWINNTLTDNTNLENNNQITMNEGITINK